MSLETVGNTVTRWATVLVPARQLAEVISDTEFVPKAMRGKPDVVTACIMYGDELGLDPMQSLAGIAMVDGRPQVSAETMRGMIFRAGHEIAVHEMTGQKARVSGLRAGRPEAERLTVEWSWDMARAAGLVNKQNWRAYPRAMLLARATSDLARLLFPDVVKGMSYIAEDESVTALEAYGQDVAQEPAPVAPPRAPQRKRRPRALPNPGHHLATEDKPGPDGSVDVPMPDTSEPDETPSPPVEYPPETTPEEPPAEGEPPPKGMGERPFKAMQAALARVLGKVPRDDRLGALAAIVGRPVESSGDLTRDEGYRVLGFLDRVNVGAAGLVKRGGSWEAVAYDVAGESGPDPWIDPEAPEPAPWDDLGGRSP